MYPHFKSIYKSSNHLANRDVINGWADGFIDRDNKFVKEFQTTFNSSFWELYLHGIFKEYGFDINMKNDRPDFILKKNNQEVVVEAVIASNAENTPPEYTRGLDKSELALEIDFSEFNKETMIRLASAIISKWKKYKNSYYSLKNVKGKPFVIALAPFHMPLHYFAADVPIRALLYDYYVDEQAEKKTGSHPPTVHLESITKPNGAEIYLGWFNDDSMKEVSAVIFNPTATFGKTDALCKMNENEEIIFSTVRTKNNRLDLSICSKRDYYETILDGLQVYHNPYAKYPLDEDFFFNKDVVQCIGYDPNTQALIYDSNLYNNGFLFFRLVNKLIDNL